MPLVPRVVVVSRRSDYEELLRRHGTAEQARFFLRTRGQDLEAVETRHHALACARAAVLEAIPLRWRRAVLDRHDLHRFYFEPDDLVVAVGQDGLVPNIAKYLDGQPVVGVNPEHGRIPGVLCRHPAGSVGDLLRNFARGRLRIESRAMVEVLSDDGQRTRALNDVFVGHRSHQSARYTIAHADMSTRQSSSGVVVSTGTGATAWARSLAAQLAKPPRLPTAAERRLVYFVREPFPSTDTTVDPRCGEIGEGETLELVSELQSGGVVFGDGIEDDAIEFPFGARIRIRAGETALALC